jgi:SAM-dependent methyltransferase
MSETDDRPVERELTAHERMSGQPWDASYTGDEPAPWDIGGPQPAVERLLAEGLLAGAVLDAGCGSGENALLIAAAGLPVLGFDVAGTALATARASAAEQGLTAEFVEADALRLGDLGRTFDTVIDSGLFHALDDEERARYVASLATVTASGATVFVLCFGDEGPNTGPHPVTQADLRAAFGADWTIERIEHSIVRTNYHDENGAPAWLATVRRQ